MAKDKLIDLKQELNKARARVEFRRFAKDRITEAEKLCKKQRQELDRLLFLNVLCLENGRELTELQETQEWFNEFIVDQAYRND